MLSTLNWIAFLGPLLGIYVLNIMLERMLHKKWDFKVDPANVVVVVVLVFLPAVLMSDLYADGHVNVNIQHTWEEQVLLVQDVEDVSRNLEKEGSFFLGFGSVSEREAFRYTVLALNETRTREKIYASDCIILKAEKKPKILKVKKVRVYKDPRDKEFFKNMYDKKDGFYKVYIL